MWFRPANLEAGLHRASVSASGTALDGKRQTPRRRIPKKKKKKKDGNMKKKPNTEQKAAGKENMSLTHRSVGEACWKRPLPWVSPLATSRTMRSPLAATTLVGQISTSTP